MLLVKTITGIESDHTVTADCIEDIELVGESKISPENVREAHYSVLQCDLPAAAAHCGMTQKN